MSFLTPITRFSSSDIREIGEKMSTDSSSNLHGIVTDHKSPLLVRDMAATELVRRGMAEKVPVRVLQDLNKNPRLPDALRSKIEQTLAHQGASMDTAEFTEID